jgi:hypothetical protein
VDGGWKMSTGKFNGLTVIQMTKNVNRLVFCEQKDKKRLCFLNAKVVRDVLVSNINYGEDINNINVSITNVKPNESDNEIKHEKLEDNIAKEAKDNDNEKKHVKEDKPKMQKIDCSVAHDKWGHYHEEKTRLLAKNRGYVFTGTLKSCDACDIVKTKATKIPKSTKVPAKKVGEKMSLDISGPFPLSNGRLHMHAKQNCSGIG